MKNQGLAHLAGIFLLPVVVIGIFYAPIWLKVVLIVLFFSLAYFIWKKIK